MSLETAIQENTRAIKALAELLKQAMGMLPPTGTAPVTPTAPQPAPKPEADKAPATGPEPKPISEPAPEPVPEPVKPVDLKELRKSLMPKVQALFTKSISLGQQVLAAVGAKNVTGVPDDKLEEFAASVDKALAGA